MTKDEIEKRVVKALAASFGIDEDEIKPETQLDGNLNADWYDLLDIVFRLEREFDIHIKEGELFQKDAPTDPYTVGYVCSFVESKLDLPVPHIVS